MATSKIILRPDAKSKNGLTPIWLQVFLKGVRLRLPLGVSIEAIYFDKEKERVKKIPNNQELTDTLNGIIHKAKSKSQKIFSDSVFYGTNLTKAHFLAEYNAEAVSKKSFTRFFEKAIDQETDKAVNTVRSYRSTLNYWKGFRDEVNFGELTFETIEAFDKFLRKKGVTDTNTLHKHHKVLKKFVNLAIARGNKIANPYAFFKLKTAEVEIEFLKIADLEKLIDLYQSDKLQPTHKKVLRYFLFSATCGGLRYSDVAQLGVDDIKGDLIVFQPLKTQKHRKSLTIPLSKFGKKMIDEALEDKQRVRKTIFAVLSNQKTNKAMKEIAAMVGLHQKCSFHCARHTFATIFLSKNKDIVTLKDILGHSDIKTTSRYTHASHEQKVEQMLAFNELFNM